MLSVWLLIKSHSINKTLKIISQQEIYNTNSNLYANRFSGFKESILIDGDNSSSLFHRILEDIYRVEKEFHSLLLKHELKKKTKNTDKICTYLDYFIGHLRIKEDHHGKC